MAKIHEDRHGVYVKAGGYIFRPIFPRGYSHVYTGGTVFSAGDTVKAYHHCGSSLGSVARDGIKEKWYSHGCYYDSNGGTVSSENFFQPSYESW